MGVSSIMRDGETILVCFQLPWKIHFKWLFWVTTLWQAISSVELHILFFIFVETWPTGFIIWQMVFWKKFNILNHQKLLLTVIGHKSKKYNQTYAPNACFFEFLSNFWVPQWTKKPLQTCVSELYFFFFSANPYVIFFKWKNEQQLYCEQLKTSIHAISLFIK